MTIERSPIQSPAIKSVIQKFKIWRKTRTRGTRIPEELWQAAINVYHSENLTLHKVARELHLNQTDFKKHFQKNIIAVKKLPPG